MRKCMILLTVMLITITAFSCYDDIEEPEYPVAIVNPFENIQSFFSMAERMAGEGTALYLITGVQNNNLASQKYRFIWKYHFIKGKRIITFECLYGKTEITDMIVQETPVGSEYIYKDDDRLDSVFSIKTVWDTCMNTYNKPILNIDIYVPLLAQKSPFIYSFHSNDGMIRPGINSFLFDASNGNDITFE